MVFWEISNAVIHAVPYPKLVVNVLGLCGSDPEFSADIGHVHLEFFNAAVVGTFAPDLFDHGRIGHKLATMLRKERKDVILRLGQLHLFPAQKGSASVVIDGQFSAAKKMENKSPKI